MAWVVGMVFLNEKVSFASRYNVIDGSASLLLGSLSKKTDFVESDNKCWRKRVSDGLVAFQHLLVPTNRKRISLCVCVSRTHFEKIFGKNKVRELEQKGDGVLN